MTHQSHPLLAGIAAETLAIRQFHDTLQAEQKALVDNDANALADISQTKQKQVETLNQLASNRMQQLVALGFGASGHGVAKWLATADDATRKAWKQLLDIAREAQTCNQINGNLIQKSMVRHQQALSALMTAANQASLYDASGQPQGSYPGAGSSRGIIGTA